MPICSMKRGLSLTCLVFVLAISPALARDFDIYGTNEGQFSRDECPAGQYFVGLVGNTGSWIDQITVVCAELKPDGTFGPGRTLPSRGGSGGAFKQEGCLGKDEAIGEIRIQRTVDYQIQGIKFICVSIRTWARAEERRFSGSSSYFAQTPTHACSSGELATGLSIRHGQYVNGVALICSAIPTAAAAACQAGMVWRESFEGDTACVTPDARFRLADGRCRSGYVWRDTFSGDNVCVTPEQQKAAKAQATANANQAACDSYADQSLVQIEEANRLNCDLDRTSNFWTGDRAYQIKDCQSHGTSAASVSKYNLITREQLLAVCRQKATNAGAVAPPPAPVAATATATADVDLYDVPGGGGKTIGILTKDEVVPLGGCRDDGWCEVPGRGWVWGEFLAR